MRNDVILYHSLSGCGAVGSALDWGSRGREFKSRHSDQKYKIAFAILYFFIHCESNGISSRFSVYIFRNDDIQSVALMVYNFYEIDDIHGYAVIL